MTEPLFLGAAQSRFGDIAAGCPSVGISLPAFQKTKSSRLTKIRQADLWSAENNKELEIPPIATNCGLAQEAWASPNMPKPLPITISIFPPFMI
jgi:hypothetical protein